MRVADAQEIVEAARVDPTYFSFDGERHEALCLLAAGQTWQVFLSERGQRYEERSFETEDEACTYFLKRLFKLWRPR
ncbi:MAG: hypothetical protein ACR2LQ_04980 [Acidimicrobiales bacterium]